MSLKDNVNYIKEEISTEEQFLEGFVKFERIYKKYKFIIISSVALLVIGVAGSAIKDYIDNDTKQKANIAYNKLLVNSNDTASLAILKDSNEKLYNIFMAMTKQDGATVDTPYLKELTEYSTALEKSDMATLNSLTLNQEFILSEYALINKALLQTKNGEYKEAKATLSLISKESPVSQIADSLKHHLVTK